MNKVYIFGHKKPDTDSVTSAITLSYLKNVLGTPSEPRVLGNINNETKYVLDYFKVPVPEYLEDVKLQISDIKYHKDFYINEFDSIYNSYTYMSENHVSTLPVVDSDNKFCGIVSMKDIAKDQILGNSHKINTSFSNLVNTLSAEVLLQFDDEIEGNLIVTTYRSTTFVDTIKLNSDDILIVGDRHSLIEYAVNSGIKMIIVNNSVKLKEEHINIAKQKKVNIIVSPYDTFKIIKIINLCNYVSVIKNNNQIITFNENMAFNDCLDVINRGRHSYYPIVDTKNVCLGMMKLSAIASKNKKQVILVDHNEMSQSAEGIEEAEIIEIIDHHRIGTLGTTVPINFRNAPVGSTNTIIYELYKENGVPIPKVIAGLMMSGIISDTLLLKSPTTTEKDIKALEELSNIGELDYNTFGNDMFKAGFSLEGRSVSDIFYTDFKNYTLSEKNIGISQTIAFGLEEIKEKENEYIELLNDVAVNGNYALVCFFVTDIINEGSYIYFNESGKSIVENAFDITSITQGYYLPKVVSRKKQMVPRFIEVLERDFK